MRIVIDGRFRLGNEIVKTMSSVWLADRLGVKRLEGVWLPEFGLETPVDGPVDRCRVVGMDNAQRYRLDELSALAADAECDGIVNWTLGQRMEYLDGQADAWRDLLARPDLRIPKAGSGEVAIHVRAGDALALQHRGYYPLPFAFYETVLRELDLRPVFVGLLDEEHAHLRALRDRFPGARFVSGTSAEDFELIRRARTKVLSISTFAWTAAWLGDDDSRVIQPIAGLYDPLLWPEVDLLPTDDPRYEFRRLAPLEVRPGQALEEFHEELSRRSSGFPRVTPLLPPLGESFPTGPDPGARGRHPRRPEEWRDAVRSRIAWA